VSQEVQPHCAREGNLQTRAWSLWVAEDDASLLAAVKY
jgi:hypothetical protein